LRHAGGASGVLRNGCDGLEPALYPRSCDCCRRRSRIRALSDSRTSRREQ
jgi:hypothetical protein